MAINNKFGITHIKSPIDGTYKAVKKMWIRGASGWQPVVAGYIKVSNVPHTWERIYPTPSGNLFANLSSLSFTVYQNLVSETQTINISNTGTESLTIQNVTVSNSIFYSASLTPNVPLPVTLSPGQSVLINMNVYGLQLGNATGDLLTVTASIGLLGQKILTIPVSVNVLPKTKVISFQSSNVVTSTSIILNVTEGAALPSTTIPIFNNGNGATLNLNASSGSIITVSAFSPSITSPNGSGFITLTPIAKPIGVYVENIAITSDDSTNPTITVNVNYTVVAKAPRISVSPNQLSVSYFDTDIAGPSRTITITNSGSAELIIYSVTQAKNKSTIVGPTTPIAAGTSATFTVTGIALTESVKDSITINHNDTSKLPIVIPVSYNIDKKQASIQVYPSDVTPAASVIVTPLSNWTLGFNNIPNPQTLVVKNTSTGPAAKNLEIYQINSVQGKCSFTSINNSALSLPQIVPPGQTFSFLVKLPEDYNSSGQIDTVSITTNTTTFNQIPVAVPLLYTYIPKFPNIVVFKNGTTAELTLLDLGTITEGDTPNSVLINIQNNVLASGALIVDSITPSTGSIVISGLSFPLTVVGVKQFTAAFTGYNALAPSSTTYTESITIASNDPDTPSYVIQVKVRVIAKSAVIATNATAYKLEYFYGDPVDTAQVIISNSGNAVLNITSIRSKNNYFTVSATTATVAVNSYTTITIAAVSRNDVSRLVDSIEIQSDASNAATFVRPVTVIVKQPADSVEFSTDGNYTLPYTVREMKVTVIGGGGGGGGAIAIPASGDEWLLCGGGGGSGGYYKDYQITTDVPKGTLISRTIGAGGAGATASGPNSTTAASGSAGTNTTLTIGNILTLTATGGKGGAGGSGTKGGTGGTGGTPEGVQGTTGQVGPPNGSDGPFFSDTGGKIKSGYTTETISVGFGGTVTVEKPVYYPYGQGGDGGLARDINSFGRWPGNAGTKGRVILSWPAYTPQP